MITINSLMIILILLGAVENYAYYLLIKRKTTATYLFGLLLYIIVGLVLAELFTLKGLAKTHYLYDIITVLISTAVGYILLKEKITNKQFLGMFFGFLSIYLITSKDF